MLATTRRWLAAHPNWALALVTVAVLAPFLAKPFNIDDPLFIWVAQQIQAHPGNPYGSTANWYGTTMPMWENLWDPPVACYYLAAAATLAGWSEVALHTACLLPALALILGTYRLARRFCKRPMLAALATLFTPAVLVSSTTVMCDVLMVSFWVWAVVLWMEGLDRDDIWRLAGSALLASLALMTKQFGMSLVPLLAVYSIGGNRKSARWAFCLLVPVATMLLYQWTTAALYGQGLYFNAGSHAMAAQEAHGHSVLTNILVALTFTGGCVASATIFAPLLWQAPVLAGIVIGTIVPATAVFLAAPMLTQYPSLQAARFPSVAAQVVFWAVGGVCVLALAAAKVRRARDPESWLLFLWVAGTFVFAAFFNWTVNSRSILPMVPAVAILLVSRWEQGGQRKPALAWACLAVSACLSLGVARADWLLAKAVRQSAEQTETRYGRSRKTLWFQGHWGFQYYMAKLGASTLDFASSPLKIGDFLAIPVNNANTMVPQAHAAELKQIITVPKGRWLTTMDGTTGAGFYAATYGPLPFAFGPVPPERVFVFSITNLVPASVTALP